MSAASPSSPARWPVWLADTLVAAGIVVFTVVHTRLATWKSNGLMAEWAFDLTFFHNLVWNTANGYGYTQSGSYHEKPGIFGETHFEPILLLAVPPYWVAPGLSTLFAVQSFLIGLTAWGIARLFRSSGLPAWASPLAAAGWLLWWPVFRMAQADIRPLMWAMPFLVLALAALREARRWEAFAWGLLACFCREEVPVMLGFACVGAALWGKPPARQRRWAAGALLVAAGVFFATTTALRSNAMFYINPRQWLHGLLQSDGQDGAWGHSTDELLPVRLRYLSSWLVPLGLGAAFAPEALLGAAPLMVYLFSQAHEWASWEGPYVHHAAPGLAIFGAAAALGWGRFGAGALELTAGWRRRGLAGALLATAVALLAVEARWMEREWERTIAPEIGPWREQHDRVREAHRLAALVPPDASVAADWDTVHLFSGRRRVYCYHQEAPEPLLTPPTDRPLEGPLIPRAGLTPQFMLVDLQDVVWVARTRAAGLSEVARGEEWVLFGPAPG